MTTGIMCDFELFSKFDDAVPAGGNELNEWKNWKKMCSSYDVARIESLIFKLLQLERQVALLAARLRGIDQIACVYLIDPVFRSSLNVCRTTYLRVFLPAGARRYSIFTRCMSRLS